MKELSAEIDEKRHEKKRQFLELEKLEGQIADVERQIESISILINLDEKEKELRESKTMLNGLTQELTQLKNELKDVSDYNELKSYFTLCQILISIHK